MQLLNYLVDWDKRKTDVDVNLPALRMFSRTTRTEKARCGPLVAAVLALMLLGLLLWRLARPVLDLYVPILHRHCLGQPLEASQGSYQVHSAREYLCAADFPIAMGYRFVDVAPLSELQVHPNGSQSNSVAKK